MDNFKGLKRYQDLVREKLQAKQNSKVIYQKKK